MHQVLDADDTQEAARLGLLLMMRGVSEEYWCAGWLIDLEYVLWEVVIGKPSSIALTERQTQLLRLLSEEAGGWWRYADEGEQFLLMEDWLEHLRARRNSQAAGN